MTDALSQHDIDRLLGDAGATLPPESAPRAVRDDGGDVHAYDFRRPHRISRERLRTLEAMYERLCKGLEAWVVSRVRGHVELRLQGLEQFSFGEFTQSLANPCATYAIDIADAGGAQGCVDVGQEFAYFLVDRLFGGGGAAGAPARALSPVERLAVRTVADKTAQLLEEIWADHVPLSLAVAGFESSPEILQVANRDDPMLVATVEVLAGQVSSLLVVCLPFGVLEKFFQASGPRRVSGSAASDHERETARLRAERALRATSVVVSARLPEFRLSLRDLGALRVGQVVATGIARDAELQVLVGGHPRAAGAVGRVGRRLAVRLLDPVAGAPPLDDPDVA
jgi:flagellar motor switch protein FliM